MPIVLRIMATRTIARKCYQTILAQNLGHFRSRPALFTRAFSSPVNIYNDKDPAPYFFNEKVQTLMKKLTGLNFDKVYRTRRLEKRLNPPKYEFLTNEELQEALDKAKERCNVLLQMPPVVKERQKIDVVLSKDPTIEGDILLETKTMFVDISLGVSDVNRLIVVRETDGTLRQAVWEERDRLNQVYNPKPGRKITKPAVFLEENLKNVLSREEYEFILDLACTQFDPDTQDFQRVCSLTYEDIDQKQLYEKVHSTRHYGPMCFYLAWHKKIDNLLIHLIQQEKLDDSVCLVQLYHHIHKECKSALMDIDPNQHVSFVKAYIEEDSSRRAHLQLAVQQYEDLLTERENHKKDVQAAHGL